MARPRSISDEAILDATLGLMTRLGPEALTLALVGKEVGLVAATLVQRFSTKELLMRAALSRSWDALEEATATQDAAQPESFDGALGLLGALWPSSGDGPDYANGLLLLREDLRDPVLRARGVAWFDALALALGRRITADPQARRRLGRLMVCQWQGAQIWWAFSRRGSAAEMIGNDLKDWLAALRLA